MTTLNDIKFAYAIYYPFIGIRVRGKLGGIAIFKEYWYGRRVDRLYYPYNPQTEKQQAWRGYFADGMAAWQALPIEEKRVWNESAKRYRLYGYHRFMKKYMELCRGLI